MAVLTASCGVASFTTKHEAAARRLARTDPSAAETNIGNSATLDRSTTTTTAGTAATAPAPSRPGNYPPGVTSKTVDGIELVLQTNETATFRQGTAVHLVLSVTNKTGRTIGYLTNRETHFALIDQANKTLWDDQTCRAHDTYNTVPTGFLEIAPADHISVDDYYPTHPGTPADGCTAPAGHAYLTGGLTVCLNLADDDTCRGASDQRIQAMPIAVTVA